jgi:hypothetical protein
MLPNLSKCEWTGVPSDTEGLRNYWVNVAEQRVQLHKEMDEEQRVQLHKEMDEENHHLFYKFVEQVGHLVNNQSIGHSAFRYILIKFRGIGVKLTKEVMEMVRKNDWDQTWEQLLEFFGRLPPGVSGFHSKSLADRFEEAVDNN